MTSSFVCRQHLLVMLAATLALASAAIGQEEPKLVGFEPANGAVDVSLTAALRFTFDMAMEASPAVGGAPPFLIGGVGMSGVSSGLFLYEWSQDGKVLTCTPTSPLPGDQDIVWTLNPTGANAFFSLKSEAGVVIPTGLYSGSFRTAGGDPGGCEPEPSTRGSVTFFKQARYLQAGNGVPTLDPERPFFASTQASPSENDTMESATLTFPDGSSRQLPNLFGSFFEGGSYATEAALNAAYPAGNYQWSIVLGRRAEPYALAMAVPASFTSVPRIANAVEFGEADPTRDFTLSWTPFLGPGPNDSIYLLIAEAGGEGQTVFQAPDLCVPRELRATDTSIVVPANTLLDGKRYDITLNFTHVFASGETALPETDVVGSVSVTTNTQISKGSQPTLGPPALEKLALSSSGAFSGELHGLQGQTYRIEASADLRNWEEIQRLPLSGTDSATFVIPPSNLDRRYFRAELAE